MRKQGYLLVIAVCLGSGCSADTADSVPVQQAEETAAVTEAESALSGLRQEAAAASGGRYPWDREPRPYTVIEYAEVHDSAGKPQQRTVKAVLPEPETRGAAEAAVQEIYQELATDVKRSQPRAGSGSIRILLYDSLDDGTAADGSQIVQVSAAEGSTLPAWDEADIRWSWRSPEHRPPAAQRALFHEYWSGIDQCTRTAEAPFHNAAGEFIGEPGDQEEIDWRFAEERWQLIETLKQRYSLTEEELATQIATVSVWRQGDIPGSEEVARSAKSFLERWADR